ncbi:10895_t:CDS:1, partial [Scutellospora calospora]
METRSKKKNKKKFRENGRLQTKFCTNKNCPRLRHNFISTYFKQDCKDTYIDDEREKWHRVFAEWNCYNKKCKNKWKSGYAWILLEKYENNIPAIDLTTEDYLKQECKRCHNKVNNLADWHHLLKDQKEAGGEHRSDLCEKCRA